MCPCRARAHPKILGGYLMKTQMRFQKYICLIMLILGAVAVAYSFFFATGGLSELGYAWNSSNNVSLFTASAGKNDASLYVNIQGFNDALMYCGIVIILLAVCLYITSCHKRRNYYISNYVATGVCAGGSTVISLILMVLDGIWMGRFKNIDFASWSRTNAARIEELTQYYQEVLHEEVPANVLAPYAHYSESTAWFAVGFVVYTLVIVASVLLVLNLVWKLKLMQGEKKLLNGSQTVEGGAAV